MKPPEPRGHQHDMIDWWVSLFAVPDDLSRRIPLAHPIRCDTETQAKRQAEMLLNLHRGRFNTPGLSFVAEVSHPHLKHYTAYLLDATTSLGWEELRRG